MTMTEEKVFKKYGYDISLQQGVGSHLVIWITGLMVFFITLTLAVNIGLAAVAKEWVTGLSGSLTVEIPPPIAAEGQTSVSAAQQKAFEAKAEKILWLAKQHPAVAESHALTKDEIRSLIEPWFGEEVSDELPLPALIDLKLAAEADTTKLQQDIRDLIPEANIDTHTDTLDDVNMLLRTARIFVLLLTTVILFLAIATISGIVKSKCAIHQQEVETLHLLGASDEYIAQQFRQHTLQGTLKGAAGGVACMIFTILVIGAATRTIDAALLPHLKLTPLHWGMLILAPVLMGAVIAHVTAQVTVMRTLAKLS
jgi:cell division transport system permease protein